MTAGFAFGALSQTTMSSLAQNAPSPEALQAAQELASLTSASVVKQAAAPLVDQVWPSVEAGLRLKNPMIDTATLAQLRKEFEDLQSRSILEAMADAAPIYARYFTTEELRYLIAFYRTPLGVKTLGVMPRASLEILQAIAPKLQTMTATINQRFSAILQEHGYKP
jgi:uncharacterized protein